MRKLPLWIMNQNKPSVYDSESATAIEMVGKVYGAMQELIDEYNSFATNCNKLIEDFTSGALKDAETFRTALRQEFQDFIDVVNLKIMSQDKKISDLSNYVKNNIAGVINDIIAEMKENGELSDDIIDSLDILNKQVILKDNAKITFLGSEGSEDCGLTAVFQTTDKCFIFDLGFNNTCKYLIDFINENNIAKVDGVIISHLHDDHIGSVDENYNAVGFNYLMNALPNVFADCKFYLPHKADSWIEQNWMSVCGHMGYKQSLESIVGSILNKDNIVYPAEDGYIVEIDENTRIKFYNLNSTNYNEYFENRINYNDYPSDYAIYNNFSMISIIEHHNNKIGITGDIEYLAEGKYSEVFNGVDVLQIEHHNENSYSHPDYLKNITAKIGVIPSCTYFSNDRRFRPTTNQILNCGGKVFYTSDCGNVEIISTERDIYTSGNAPIDVNNTASYSLGYGNKTDCSDMNNLLEPGVYTFKSYDEFSALANIPDKIISGCKVIVEDLTHDTRVKKQTVISANDRNYTIAVRLCYNDGLNGMEFKPWKYYYPAEVIEYEDGFYELYGDGRYKIVCTKTFTPTETNTIIEGLTYSESLYYTLPFEVNTAYIQGTAEPLAFVTNMGKSTSNDNSIYFRLVTNGKANVDINVTLTIEGKIKEGN